MATKPLDRYAQRGVSSGKEDVHKAIKKLDKGLYPNAFCKIFPSMRGEMYGSIMHADGAGSKAALAYAYWKQTGDLTVLHGLAQDSMVMNFDDLLCIGATGHMDVSSTLQRNKRLISAEAVQAIIEGTQIFIDDMNSYGYDMRNMGGETADLGDLVRTLVLDHTFHTEMHRAEVIDLANVRPGDVIVGLASYGQASYEKNYNSGMGSNGLTSARHDIFGKYMAKRFPDTFDPKMKKSLRYCGKHTLLEVEPETGRTFGQLVLSPTRTYGPIMKKLFESMPKSWIHGIVHCSGGGQTKCLHYIDGMHIVKDKMLPVPPLFRIIQQDTGTPPHEMYRTFNMGHRMEIYLPEVYAETVIEVAKGFNVEAQVIGRCDPHRGHRLTIYSQEYGKLKY